MSCRSRFSPLGRVFSIALLGISFLTARSHAALFLFDATKAEMAGNADWVIDADLHNLQVSSAANGSGTPNVGGTESNPQRVPTPPASGITSSTAETYWEGGLSAWAIDLVKNGHGVETLPYNGRITYGDSTNPQDLTNYNVFVMVEPNILFTSTEKTAILNFVTNGGGLFIVSDHGGSDRNNDGADSVEVLNGFMGTNSIKSYPFGFRFNGDDVSPNSSNVDTNASDPVIHGPAGTAVNFVYNDGSTITLNTNQNASVQAAVWSASPHATNNALVVFATYGAGKVVAAGDSSPFDDGTGDPGDSLFYSQGYADPSTSNGRIILNAALWLAQPSTPPSLQISLTNGQIRFAWAASATGYNLHGSTNLAQTNVWSAVTNVPTLVSNQNVVSIPISGSLGFYRLQKP